MDERLRLVLPTKDCAICRWFEKVEETHHFFKCGKIKGLKDQMMTLDFHEVKGARFSHLKGCLLVDRKEAEDASDTPGM